ncbi:MAG: TIGR04255 family protein [Pseudomonadota bacterium]
MGKIPKKLINDSIVDAVFEVRFESSEQVTAPNLIVGYLAGNSDWKSRVKAKLPVSDIPDQFRMSDPNLRHQATLELADPESNQSIKLGEAVASTSRQGEYPGWGTMVRDISEMLEHSFKALEDFRVVRVGMRYINVLVPDIHFIDDVHSLNFELQVGGTKLEDELNINFKRDIGSTTHTVRIASKAFVKAMNPESGVALIDIDSWSVDPKDIETPSSILNWAEKAHIQEKEIFFSLIPEAVLTDIVKEWS